MTIQERASSSVIILDTHYRRRLTLSIAEW